MNGVNHARRVLKTILYEVNKREYLEISEFFSDFINRGNN
jgi:hypothetical protein